MYGIKLEKYVPAPKPATADRIVAVHYYPAWKKESAGLHNGFDDLHDYPERTPLLGYYDEENPINTDFEIKWALEHGINCFVYCWYRKKENENKPVSPEYLRCGHGIHEGLFNAKYQNMINFAIMYENAPRWGSTNKKDFLENLLPFWTENYFSRENYLKIDGKPMLFICGKAIFDKVFDSVEEQRETLDAAREYLRARGYGGLLVGACIWDYMNVDQKLYDDVVYRGYDFSFPYNAGYAPEASYPTDEEIIENQCSMLKRRLAAAPMRHLPIASCFRDARPRTAKHWMDLGFKFDKETIYHLSPEGYRSTIRRMKKMADALPEGALGRRIFMIDNWNEWDEGHYISPSHEYGFRYLQAIREELTECDNIPDYRTPVDMGLKPETSWEEPDFTAFCEERLQKNESVNSPF